MKKLDLILYTISALICTVIFTSCSDDDLGSEAAITQSFSVIGQVDGKDMPFRAVINNDNTITIKVSPYVDAAKALEAAKPTFYLSKGATVSPDPGIPQNFTQEGGVKYTVTSEDKKNRTEYTVSWGISDKLPYGSGFSYAEIGTKKNFVELGYPGEFKNFNLPDNKLYGDLQMYHAYCGNHIVMLSRAYADLDATSPYCIKVLDKINLTDAGTFNLGSISIKNLKMITSDYKGRCVGAVTNGTETEFFYWIKPTDTPKSIGKIAINMASAADLSNNFQVAGDITGNAWITALAPRGPKGQHYRIKVTGGQLASSYSTIETGYSSGDCSGFQMISPLDDSDEPSFVIGDTEGTVGSENSIKCYINTYTGTTTFVMPAFWQNILRPWWVGTGYAPSRMGSRSPVSALVINGKTYVTVTSGSAFWHAAAVVTPDLQTLAHENLNIADEVSRLWSYGAWVDWYWDEGNEEAYLAVWFGRMGLYTYKLTCYE